MAALEKSSKQAEFSASDLSLTSPFIEPIIYDIFDEIQQRKELKSAYKLGCRRATTRGFAQNTSGELSPVPADAQHHPEPLGLVSRRDSPALEPPHVVMGFCRDAFISIPFFLRTPCFNKT